MNFNKFYILFIFISNFLQNVSSFGHDLKENQNQIIGDDSITNQIIFKDKQAGNCDEFLSNNNAIKAKHKILIEKGHNNIIDDSSSTYSFKVNKKISIHTCKAFTSMCNLMLTAKCSKSTMKNNKCSQLSSIQFTSKCLCNDDYNQISFSEKISDMLRPSNIKVISEHCRFNCYDYKRVCNEKCGNISDLKKIETSGKPIINFCNYKYQDDIFEIGCICDNGIQRTNRILDSFIYRCEFNQL